ncbi:MAG: ESPR domain-containing protein [Deltaproteobacteria bacterium]|nr:ESPR domain-containing protein [Deltaproteobacteria bacterium]
MNRIYRLIWNNRTGTFVAVSENAKSTGKKSSSGATVVAMGARLVLTALAIPVMMSLGTNALRYLPAASYRQVVPALTVVRAARPSSSRRRTRRSTGRASTSDRPKRSGSFSLTATR